MTERTSRRRRRGTRPASGAPSAAAKSPAKVTVTGALLVLVVTVVLIAYVRVRLADLPLERDEGEYAYAGQLVLEGIPPYLEAYNMKFPGTYYAYAGLMAVFGQSAGGIRTGLLAWHLATIAVVFVLGRRLLGTPAAAAGAAVFALLAIDRWSMGTFAHATHFVMLPAMAGLLVLHAGMSRPRGWRFVVAGVFMGIAIAMKQHAASFALLAVALAMWSGRSGGAAAILRRGVLVIAGVAMPVAAIVAVLAAQGALGRFWFWTIQYAAAYVSQVPASEALSMFALAWRYITQSNAWVWYAGLAGLVLLFVTRWPAESRIWIGGWLLAAALAIVPGFFFRPHYFIVLMPVAGLLTGVVFALLDRWAGRVISVAALVVLAGSYVFLQSEYLFRMTPTQIVRSVYDANPFLEAPEIARYLKSHTKPQDRVVVFGSEPEIFFYSGRKSATGYIYMYPLMEQHAFAAQMQDEMRREVEAARPAYLVFVANPLSWGGAARSDTRILTWANELTSKCYDRVGIADIDPSGPAVIRWDADSAGYQARSRSQVLTFRRKSTRDCGSP